MVPGCTSWLGAQSRADRGMDLSANWQRIVQGPDHAFKFVSWMSPASGTDACSVPEKGDRSWSEQVQAGNMGSGVLPPWGSCVGMR